MLATGVWIFTWEDLLLLPILVGYAAWWASTMHRGSEGSRLALTGHIAVYALLSLWVWIVADFELAGGGDLGKHLSSAQAEALFLWFFGIFVVPLGAYLGFRSARGRLNVALTSSGGWVFRGAWGVPIVWMFLYLARMFLEDYYLKGYSVLLGPILTPGMPAGVSDATYLLVVATIAIVYYVSFGVMIGLSVAIWRVYHAERRAAHFAHPQDSRGTSPVQR